MKTPLLLLCVAWLAVTAAPGAEPTAESGRIGNVSVDANWDRHSAYLQGVVERVEAQWRQVLAEGKIEGPKGSQVTVTFNLNTEGQVAGIFKIEGSLHEAGRRACINGINANPNYGKWTDAMKEVLGDFQRLTFTFNY